MKVKFVLFGALLTLASCSNANLENKANELCKSHSGLSGYSGSEKKAVCKDTTIINL